MQHDMIDAHKTTWKRLSAVIVAMLVFIMVPWQSHGQSPAIEALSGAPSPDLRLVESSNEAIILELDVPVWQVSTRKAGAFELDEIGVSGFSYTSDPGTPRLPVKFVTLGIPPGIRPRVQVLETDEPRIESGYRLAANPSPSPAFDPAAPFSPAALNGPPMAEIEPASGDELYPAELAEIVQVGRLRSQPFVQIRLNPFQYHPQKRILRVHTHLRVAVTFDPPASSGESGPVDEGPLESALRSLLFNYAQARTWRMPQSLHAQAELQSFYTGERFRIEVTQEGLYQLTRTMLFVSGQTSQIYDDPLSTFQLFEDFNLTSEVALEIVDVDGDDHLDFDDIIRFYGRGPDEAELRYTDTRVYWLVAGRAAGKRMATRTAPPGSGTLAPDFPTTVHVEKNELYWSNSPTGGAPDPHWFYSPGLTQTSHDTPLVSNYSVSTPNRSSVSHTVTVRARLAGFTDDPDVNPDHWSKLYLGSSLIASALWDGKTTLVIEGNTTSSSLNSGMNTVKIRIDLLPAVAADSLLVDWFEIDYRQTCVAQNNRLIFTRPAGYSQYQITGFSSSAIGTYDITDPRNPIQLTGTNTASGTLRLGDPTPSANRYIAVVLQAPAILTPSKVEPVDAGDDLKAPADGADYLIITHIDFTDAANRLANYRAGDFTTKVVQVQDIYNQFGNGVLDPEAIHDFLAYAYANWSPQPQYVVLMGDGTNDYRHYTGTPRQNYIPPYLAAGIDPWLGETADENYYAAVSGPDIIPDLFVGRLPANTLAEADAMVDKIIDYEAGMARPGETMLLVADNADSAGDFPGESDTLANETVPGSYAINKVYLGVNYATAAAANAAIISNIDQGKQFVNYSGHAGPQQWADEGLLVSSDADSLNNTDKFPVVLGMTCLEGSFQDYDQDVVAERLVRAANQGAIASWSATGLGVNTGHAELQRGFYDALFQGGVGRLGPATVAGKLELYKTGTNLDLIHTFALLGDPATDTGIWAACTAPQADVTNDGVVDVNDLAALSPYWHQVVGAPYDQDSNNFIDVRDFMRVAAAWNSGCGG